MAHLEHPSLNVTMDLAQSYYVIVIVVRNRLKVVRGLSIYSTLRIMKRGVCYDKKIMWLPHSFTSPWYFQPVYVDCGGWRGEASYPFNKVLQRNSTSAF